MSERPDVTPKFDVALPMPASRGDESNIKETIEQILVAFILAFIFRAFIVEAFVIPTGSMAPTLMGAHMRFVCDDCGYQFETNYNANSSGEDITIPANGAGQQRAICPNCSYVLARSQPGDQAYSPLVRYGDRILVLKYLYLFQNPARWDVVVFKSPTEQPRWDFGQNYIKRLIGRPNEAVMILDGDIYTGPSDAAREDLKVQTKPREVQDALWRIVYDNDHHPRGMPRPGGPWKQPWTTRTGQTGWDLGADAKSDGRVFQFKNDSGFAEIFFNNTANIHAVRPDKFSDWLAYDVDASSPREWSLVGDLKVQLYYDRQSGDGPLRLILSKRGETFIAEIDAQSARLLREDSSGGETEIIAAKPYRARRGPMQIEFTNLDYRVALRIDGNEVFATNEQQYHPDVEKLIAWQSGGSVAPLPPEVRIVAAKQSCAITHLSLWRDVYYLNRGTRGDLRPFAGSPDNVMRLGNDEYFVMGDNSQISGDGRYWTEVTNLPFERLYADAGKVPGRFMLGKAFFVYWPAGFRPIEKSQAPALVPDFGDMRFIH